MKIFKALSLVTFIVILVGCASTRPENLAKASRNEEINLSESISTTAFRGMHVRCEEGALPGVYVAKNEDANGVYYFGKDRSIWTTNEMIQRKPRLLVGGIYVPRNTTKGPQFFYIFEKEVHTTENINDYVMQRIVQTATVPAVGSPNVGLGVNVAGNVIGGVLVSAMIEAGVGQIEMFPPIEDANVKSKIYSGLRPSTSKPE
ncbi:hypothetical protein ACO0LD_06755 [Undibacterium sp. Ji83W]|uniref:hypothetical protein n=1 Tax=Undibacterium sp. Ji83W TaxID=3413043 RepID=UPI003BF43CB1